MKHPLLCVLLLTLCLLTACTPHDEPTIDIPTLDDSPGTTISPLTVPMIETVAPIERGNYAGDLQYILDYLHRMRDDIDALAASGIDNEAHRALRALLEDAIAGRERLSVPNPISRQNNRLVCQYTVPRDICAFFADYPIEAVEESGMVALMGWFCADAQANGSKTDNIYANDVLYSLLFPGADEPQVTVTSDGNTVIDYPGYTGEIMVSYPSYAVWRYDGSNPDMLRYSLPATLRRNHVGTISVAPINRWGAVGKISQIDLSANEWTLSEEFRLFTPTAETDVKTMLKGKKLVSLRIQRCALTNIDPLFAEIDESQLYMLDLNVNALSGEADLRACRELRHLWLANNPDLTSILLPDGITKMNNLLISLTAVDSLEFVRGMECIHTLSVDRTKISTLDPLRGIHISALSFSPEITDFSALSEIKSLISITVRGNSTDWADKIAPFIVNCDTLERIIYDDKTVHFN